MMDRREELPVYLQPSKLQAGGGRWLRQATPRTSAADQSATRARLPGFVSRRLIGRVDLACSSKTLSLSKKGF